MRIGLDIGYGYTKIATGEGKQITFPTLVKSGEENYFPEMLGVYMDYVITINGKIWYIGEMARKEGGMVFRAFTNEERYNNEIYQVVLATALAIASEDNDEPITLVTGLPLSQYKPEKENFSKFLNNYSAYVEFKGKIKEIKLDKSLVFPQAVGILFSPGFKFIKEELKPETKISVIDIGFRTTDVATFIYNENKKFKIRTEESFSIDIGMSTLFNKLTSPIINKYKLIDIPLDDVEQTFNRYLKGDTEFKDEIEKIKQQVVQEIHEKFETKTRKSNIESYVVFAGGGSIALEKELLQKFKNTLYVANTQMANSLGFLGIAELIDIM